ncbi:MAG: hypothetical protein K2X47_20175 [Bdellovibrionales bacterium]|nr:hypothetical protein [Bdellovibrionales bacterium]
MSSVEVKAAPVWREIVPRGMTTQGLWGMIFQTKSPASNEGHESFVIELSVQQANTLVMDLGTRSHQDKSVFAALEVLKALGVKVKQCSFTLGEGSLPQAELEVSQSELGFNVVLRPDQVVGFVIAQQAPFRATQEFIDFVRRSRLSSGNFSVLVSERIRSKDSRSIRWK